jgi:RNA polymerase sigma-70 factor (ECF subfamily)
MRDSAAVSQDVLLARLKAGDERALGDLADEYGTKIYQLAFRYLRNKEDAEEVTQDVLFKVYRKVDAFRGDAALSSWIYRITFNTAMSRLRTGRLAKQTETAAQTSDADSGMLERPQPEPPDWSTLADDQVMRGEMREKLVAALRHLPTVYRVPVLLRDINGLSTEEASAILRVKPQTLKSRLHRGRLILRKHLGEFAGGLELHSREAVN